MVTLIVYDLPNRDCRAKASNGEICCHANDDGTCNYDMGGDCSAGIEDYKKNYIDVFAKHLKDYAGKVDVALIIEPDSLPNLASNLSDPHCANSQQAYKEGAKYAIDTLYEANPDATMYLDAAHGGWLGWSDNMDQFTELIAGMDIASKLRGFATNVANYQALGQAMCPWDNHAQPTRNDYCLGGAHQGDLCCKDPCNLESQWNGANNELNYANMLSHDMRRAIPGFTPVMIIDTGRNGITNEREDCANWCNIRNAGVGHRPTTNTEDSELIDAYLWLKTPGESDGCTQMLPTGKQCARFDSFCGSEDSLGSRSGEPRSPEAGQWFDYQIKQLAANAHLDGISAVETMMSFTQ